MASAGKHDENATRQLPSPTVPARGRNFKLRHLEGVSLLRACPDAQLLLRASTASCASGAALELDRVGMQIIVYTHSVADRTSKSNALRCYTSEVRWGSLSPEFASIDKGALPYVAVHGYGFSEIVIEVVWYLRRSIAKADAGGVTEIDNECIERRILFSRKVDLSELGNQTTEPSSVSAQPVLDASDESSGDGIKPRTAGGGDLARSLNGQMSYHQRSRSSDSGAGMGPSSRISSPVRDNDGGGDDAQPNEATRAGTNIIENVLLLHMTDGCTYTVDTDIVAQKKRRRKKSLPLGNERRRSSSGHVCVEPIGTGENDDANRGVGEADNEGNANGMSADESSGALSRPPSRDGKASVATIDEDGGADFSDDERTTLGALSRSQRQSPFTFISYDTESYEDVSRNMSVGWAGGSLVFDDGDGSGTTSSSSSSSSSFMRRGGSRRSKSVDFNGVRVFGDQGEMSGNGLDNARMKRRSTSNADTTVGAVGGLREKGEAGRKAETSVSGRRETHTSGTSGGGSRAEQISLDAFKNDATMTVNARARLREALVRRDASSAILGRLIMRPKNVSAKESKGLVGSVGLSGRADENMSSDMYTWKEVAEEKRRELRHARVRLTSRRDELKIRSDLLIKGLRGIGFARGRLDAAQNMLLSGGQSRRHSSSNGAVDADDNVLQGVPRLRMLEKKLCARRHILVRELSRIYTIDTVSSDVPTSFPQAPPLGAEKVVKANAVLLMCGIGLGRCGGVDMARHRKTIDRSESEALGAVLGYVAQAVHVIASYLDIPLRYNIRLFAGRSVVVDLAPPLRLVGPVSNGNNGTDLTIQMSHSSGVSRRSSLGFDRQLDVDGSTASSPVLPLSSKVAPRPMSYPSVALPLYIESMNQSNEFHAAVWLLNKDIEQLLSACGETTVVGSKLQNTLENLRRLFEAVENALPRRVLV